MVLIINRFLITDKAVVDSLERLRYIFTIGYWYLATQVIKYILRVQQVSQPGVHKTSLVPLTQREQGGDLISPCKAPQCLP